MLLPVAAQERKYICKDPDDYTPSLLVGSSSATCDNYITQNNAIKNEDFSSPYSCAGKSFSILQGINDVAESQCCGAGKKSACWKERKYICKNPTDYQPLKKVVQGSNTPAACDLIIQTINSNNNKIENEPFDSTYNCDGKPSYVESLVNSIASFGCCGGTDGVSANKSACWKERKYICKNPSDYQPLKKVVLGSNTPATCDVIIQTINNNQIKNEPFNSTYNCDGKPSYVESLVKAIASYGCCGGTDGVSANKSACWRDRKYICKNPADFTPTKKVFITQYSGFFSCESITDMYSDVKAIDFSSAYSCTGTASNVKDHIQDIADRGCCGTCNQSTCFTRPTTCLAWCTDSCDNIDNDGDCVGCDETKACNPCKNNFDRTVLAKPCSCGAEPEFTNAGETDRAASCVVLMAAAAFMVLQY